MVLCLFNQQREHAETDSENDGLRDLGDEEEVSGVDLLQYEKHTVRDTDGKEIGHDRYLDHDVIGRHIPKIVTDGADI